MGPRRVVVARAQKLTLVLTLSPAALLLPAPARAEPPAARTGFQLALRTGVALPFGEFSEGQDMSDKFQTQVPLIVDVGGKVGPHLFVGGYLGFAFGGPGGVFGDGCEAANASCYTLAARAGGQIHYVFTPGSASTPWLGYGVGIETNGIHESGRSGGASLSGTGIELAHLMAGWDFRLGRVFGLGPFVDFALGEYFKVRYSGELVEMSQNIDDPALHEWLTLGIRGVFFP